MATRIDLDQGQMTYSGAGHPGAMLLRPETGVVRRLCSQNSSIGATRRMVSRSPQHAQPIAAGDRLLFFTEGVTRTVDASNRQLGQSGLAKFATLTLTRNLFEMADSILEQVAQYRYGPARDDRTLIVAEIK